MIICFIPLDFELNFVILLEDVVVKQELRKFVFQLDSLEILYIDHKVTQIRLRVRKYLSESQNLCIIILLMLYKVARLVVIAIENLLINEIGLTLECLLDSLR